jgi:hypothetical protein
MSYRLVRGEIVTCLALVAMTWSGGQNRPAAASEDRGDMDGRSVMTKRIGMVVLLAVVFAISAHGDRLLGLGHDDATLIENELEDMGVASDLQSVLSAASSHHDATVRFLAVRLLGYRPGLDSEIVLRDRLENDSSAVVRKNAALALIRLGHADAVEKAIELMVAAEYPPNQLSLAGQLAKFGEFRGYPYVVAAAVSEDQSLRFASAAPLVWFLVAGFDAPPDRPSPQELLLNLLGNESSEVRATAILAFPSGRALRLGMQPYIDLQPYVEQIRRLAEDDPSPKVREAARRWLSGAAEALDGVDCFKTTCQ